MGPTCDRGRKIDHGPKVLYGSQNRRVGAIVKVVTAPKHCTCAVDLIVNVDSNPLRSGRPGRPKPDSYIYIYIYIDGALFAIMLNAIWMYSVINVA